MTYEEFPVFVPCAEERLAAVVTVPGGPLREPGVVLLTGGNYTRTHRNRMWVRAGRELAERGHPSIRVDYHGIGDSTGELGAFRLDVPFPEDAMAAGRFLRRATGVRAILPVATCFGGRTALAIAARDSNTAGAVVFPVPIGDGSGPIPPRTRLKVRLLSNPLGRAVLANRPARRARARLAARRRSPGGTAGRFLEDLREATRHGRVWFVYGERSAGLEGLRRMLDELPAEERRRVHLEVVPGIELAGFRSQWEQGIAVDRVLRRVEEAAGWLALQTMPRVGRW